MKRNNRKRINPKYKDRVFKFLFGNPTNKEWTLALYNSVNGSNHKNPDDIHFNTIDDAVYMEMKNDVSFIILDEMNLWEHQSSFNPNMPMWFLSYGSISVSCGFLKRRWMPPLMKCRMIL